VEEWKNGRMERWKNGKMEEMEFYTSRVELCSLLFALCAMRNKRIMDKV